MRRLYFDANYLGKLQWQERGTAEVIASAPATTFLRAADALRLATAAENGFTEIHSNDKHLIAAAPLFGLRGVNVIP